MENLPTEPSNGIFIFQVSDTTSRENMQRYVEKMKEAIQQKGKITLLLEIGNLSQFDPNIAWHDVTLLAQQSDNIQKVAVVTSGLSKSIFAGLTELFMQAEVKQFETSQKESAQHWLEQEH